MEVETNEPGSSASLAMVLQRTRTPLLLTISGSVDPHPTALRRMVAQAEDAGAGMVFGDYIDLQDDATMTSHPLADYQSGSLQDAFELGPLQLWNVRAAREALAKRGAQSLRIMAWYDLRLTLAETHSLVRLPEPLCTLRPIDRRKTGSQQFDYLTASREAQIEAEEICTEYLERIGARLAGPFLSYTPTGTFPVRASVVIPVRNRLRTILDAVNSALEQQTDFAFNVIVVDNHSTDGTTEALRSRSQDDSRLVHLVPDRHDLGIGGCWNYAVNHEQAGAYVVQLDSDDCYSGTDTLARMVQALEHDRCGMAVGSYTVVDMALAVLPPGLIDHKEWTHHNGPNNALRIGGMGAPRAFATELVRRHPFPNASYGEDYAVALRISREYRVARIYDSVYLCRRWEQNSDADLTPDTKARFQTYKDRLRTLEIAARIAANRRRSTHAATGEPR